MDNAMRMGILQGLGNRDAQFGRLTSRESPALGLQPLVQRLPLDELAHDIAKVAIPAHLVDRNDVGVVQFRWRLSFPQEPIRLFCVELPAAGNLERHHPIELRITGLPHGTEGPLAQKLQQLEMRDPPGQALVGSRSTVLVPGHLIPSQVEFAAAGWTS